MSAAPETLLAARVKSVFATEFAPESWTVKDDRLLRANGKDGVAMAAVSPDSTVEDSRNANVLVVSVTVQLYLAFDPEPDDSLVIDPNVIVGYADRFRRAIGANDNGNQTDFWYLRMPRITYPLDPTGNKTRFEATVESRCDNPGITA